MLASELLPPYSLLPRPPQGLIFVVDSNDRERILEAKDELDKMVTCFMHQNKIVCLRN